jgi:RNA polymerase sigma-70 factor, ECF subfamily
MVIDSIDPVLELAMIRQIQRNQDTEAFTKLYDKYFSRVFAYIRYHLESDHDTEDLVSATFLRVLEGLDDFQWRGAGSFAAWLFTIARNLVNNYHHRTHDVDRGFTLSEFPQIEANDPSPLDVIEQKQDLAELGHMINALSPRQKEIIGLKFFGGLRNREIAILLNLDERTIASHLCRGLKELRQVYGNKEAEQRKGNSHE